MTTTVARTWQWRRDHHGTVRLRRTSTAFIAVMPAMPAQFQGATGKPQSATALGHEHGSWLWEGTA